MPVSTQITRMGEPVRLLDAQGKGASWSEFHLARLHEWMKEEAGEEMPYFPSEGSYTFKQDHSVTEHERHVWARGWENQMYTFEVLAGDVYRAWR